MAVIKCKMCGGDLLLVAGQSVAECEYCGSRQTVPSADNEKKLTLFARANRLRFACEFDKAAGIYESIVADFPEEAEAYWGLVLCKYGIEYVDDPATGKKIPTCHRSSFDSILDDGDLEQALENADSLARKQYREEAKQLETIRKRIIEVSGKEAPYDIFICYKETDEKGERTLDSVLAQDIYEALIQKGYRVFFSRITLEDKLGQEYEPYIFAALHSAKIMLVVGTDYEYFHAVWVKNEWSRFLKLMAKDKDKYLIPCYKNIDAYDMPKEFVHLQAQDLGKVGATQDLLRGIEKILPSQKAAAPAVQTGGTSDQFSIQDLLRKTQIHLEEHNWKNAQDTCNRITAIDPENAWAYIYQLARVMRITDPEKLGESIEVLSTSSYYEKALRYADPELAAKLRNWCRLSEESRRAAEVLCAPGRERAKKVKGLLSGGKEHAAAVIPDGTVMAFGSNEKGQCEVSMWRDIVAVACGAYYTVGLRADGTVLACGDNEFGQCNVENWANIVSIVCDENHTVGLCADGTAVACGNDQFEKTDVSQWENIQSVACGFHHTAALKADGTLQTAGHDRYGQRQVADWTDIADISCANVQTAGLRKNGKVVTCGCSEENRIATKNWRSIVDIATGTHHTVGLQQDGTLVTCGNDSNGCCRNTKQWANVIAVVKAYWSTLAIRADGTVLACGNEGSGMCKVAGLKLFNSIDTLEEERKTATERRRIQDVEDQKVREKALIYSKLAQNHIAAGKYHAVQLKLRGKVTACGSNEKGQCNVGDWRDIVRIACGELFTLGVHKSGTVLACGNNQDGQCNVKYWTSIKDVACGYNHAAGLRSDGTVVAAGKNDCGQCNVQDWKNVVAIACGFYHTVGLCADGTVLACGDNSHGQCDVGKWKNIVAICSNNLHTVGLRKDGTVVSCGNTADDRRNVSDWKNIVSIACGSHHTIGLQADGTVVACGDDGSGRCSQARQWHDMVGIACGVWASIGIRDDGTMVACGELENCLEKISLWRLFKNIANYSSELDSARSFRKNMVKGYHNWNSRVAVHAKMVIDDRLEVCCQKTEWKQDTATWKNVISVAGTSRFAVGLLENGTVVYCGDPANGSGEVSRWENITKIACHGDSYGSHFHVVGLRADGTVVACGYNKHGQCNVGDWKNIVNIYCGADITVGLRADGTVVACGNDQFGQCRVGNWTDITEISCGQLFTVGLRQDGTVVGCGASGRYGVDKWSNIIHISAGLNHTVGLRADGTVVACGSDEHGQCNVEKWKDVFAVACGYNYTIGIRDDGAVLSCGKVDEFAQPLLSIRNALMLSMEDNALFILSVDGTVNKNWRIYPNPVSTALRKYVTSIPTDPAEKARLHEQVQIRYRKYAGLCQHCGGELKGMFGKKCARCGRPKDY